jgi:hypothetical protein
MHPETDTELHPFGLVQPLIQVSEGRKHAQTSPDGSLRVIFMGLGVAKIDEETISEQLRNMPIVPLDNLGTHPLVGTDDVPILLWI